MAKSSSDPIEPYDPPSGTRCGAKKRNGEPCKAWGMANGRCRIHGGTSLSGPAHPNYKTGRYSKHLPSRMLNAFLDSRDDPARLELGEEISLVDARMAELLGRVDTGEAGALWQRLRETWELVQREDGKTEESQKRAGRLMAELGSLIIRGATDNQTWAAILETLERRRRLVETERKRLVDMKQLMSAEDGMVLAASLFAAVVKYVDNTDTLAAIGRELEGVLNAGPRAALPPASLSE